MVPTYQPPHILSPDNEYYPPGACDIDCAVLSHQLERRGIFDGPPRFTSVIYLGTCSYGVAEHSNGTRTKLQGGLWFNDYRDFQWVYHNGIKAKQSWITNPAGSGQYGITIFGPDGNAGGYWTIINP
jgi:hypothetical protein